jgi:hypothetical protein
MVVSSPIPLANHDLRKKKEAIYIASHWTRLHPLSPAENLARADRITPEDLFSSKSDYKFY